MIAQPDGSQTVLVVDDDDTVRTGMLGLLRAAGYAAQGYPSAAAALDACDPVRAHCAVLDIHIGVPDGFALGQSLRALAPGLPIIFITGDDDPALVHRAGSVGALTLLLKPVDADGLLALIDSIPVPPDAVR
ncbi:response regulator [Massilia cellulosiltytica]|uniref:response regulator n=1 Tax=Massilia cellulosiltytica TaxID=2683234 RepID=UPI0039B6E420